VAGETSGAGGDHRRTGQCRPLRNQVPPARRSGTRQPVQPGRSRRRSARAFGVVIHASLDQLLLDLLQQLVLRGGAGRASARRRRSQDGEAVPRVRARAWCARRACSRDRASHGPRRLSCPGTSRQGCASQTGRLLRTCDAQHMLRSGRVRPECPSGRPGMRACARAPPAPLSGPTPRSCSRRHPGELRGFSASSGRPPASSSSCAGAPSAAARPRCRCCAPRAASGGARWTAGTSRLCARTYR